MPANIFKWIAAATMLIDHAGLLLFPDQLWMRVVGRLAFPLYAFFLAEGFLHTRSRLRYFLRVFLLGAACQLVYAVASPGERLLGILLTFSASLCLMQLAALGQEKPLRLLLLAAAALGFAVLDACVIPFDYGFFGILTPVLPTLIRSRRGRVAALGVGLAAVALVSCLTPGLGRMQLFALAAVPLLLFYNGKPGKRPMKYFFYIFYPAHLALLQLCAWII